MSGVKRSAKRPPVRPEPPPDPRLQEQKREIYGVLLLGIAVLAVIAIWFNSAGFIGEIVKRGFFYLFGARGAMIPVLFIAIAGLSLFGWGRGIRSLRHFIALFMLFTVALTVLHFASGVRIAEGNWENALNGGGITGHWLALNIQLLFGHAGAVIIGILWLAIAFILAMEKPLTVLIAALFNRRLRQIPVVSGAIPETVEAPPVFPALHSVPAQHPPENVIPFPAKRETGAKRDGSLIATLQGILRGKEDAPSQEDLETGPEITPKSSSYAGQPLVLGPYTLPHINLLGLPPVKKTAGRAIDQSRKLEETLAYFGVQAKVIEVHHGPVVTRYDLQPAPGVQVRRIVSLTDDLALALAARGLRLEAPIPGKAAIGVEVPNPEPQIVTCRDVLDTKAFWNSTKLGFALGRDIGGDVVVADLTRMPHLLIAGATGSGKSVCVNTLIMSILFKAFPDEVKLIMIDPKMVELSMYNGIPHLLAPVVTEAKRAAGVLKLVVDEMDRRYKLFADVRVRDLDKYNEQLPDGDGALPYIVVIIDELADLMMVAPVEVEDSICRLAQMARATGIHLVVATQRPSVDVITGLIKANIPSRIAFAVSSQIDSRTILDGAGAERLLGRGDMLFSPSGAMKPTRIQGALVSEKEIEAVIKHWKEQGEPKYEEQFTRIPEARGSFSPDQDDLFWDAARVVTEHGHASASVLQRRLRVGYTRAARLVDMLEAKGLVGPYEGSKPREVFVTLRQLEEMRQRENLE